MMDQQAIRNAYADWYYRTAEADQKWADFQKAVEDQGLEFSTDDFGDFVESMTTIRTFGINPRQFDLQPPFEVDPYGEAIARIREALDKGMPLEGGMSHGEFLILRDVAEVLRRHNA